MSRFQRRRDYVVSKGEGVTTRHVAYRIGYRVPNFDDHGDLNDFCTYVDGINGTLKSREDALKRFHATHHNARNAVNVTCDEGIVSVWEGNMTWEIGGKSQRTRLVGPWKPN